MDEKNSIRKKNDERIERFYECAKRWGIGIKSKERFRSHPVSLN